jgi:hypothetical protein
MAKRRGSKRRVWSAADIKQLRGLAGKKSLKGIGRVLKRTEPAVRFKAHLLRISLAMK